MIKAQEQFWNFSISESNNIDVDVKHHKQALGAGSSGSTYLPQQQKPSK